MRPMRHVLPIFVALACALLIGAAPANYIPQAQYCYPGFGAPPTQLCSIIPGNIGPDPLLKRSNGYRGIVGANPTSLATDVETPFDNYSWQAFVALNWTRGKEGLPPQQGLQSEGPRVWQGFSRVAQVFGNSKVMANCQVNPGEELFSIASNGNGTAATRNEEYVQASTGDPAIDVNGNWTLYERRVNGLEIAYLKAPNGKSQWNLTNLPGQARFVADKQVVDFPSVLLPGARNGAIEIKAAWRILDPAQHAANAKKYYVVRAVVAVAPDLVDRSPTALVAPICAHVDLELVGLHIIQKNPPLSDSNLEPKWFWSTFEHVDNAPLAANACDITDPGTCTNFANSNCPAAILLGAPAYSYFNAKYPALPPNAAPTPSGPKSTFYWNPTQPFAKKYLTPTAPGAKTYVGTQISRCWQIYKLTQELNVQWQAKLRAVGSVFANYMLVGTQWGANIEPRSTPGPEDAAPNYLSNSVLETFLQTAYDPLHGYNTGSCVSCHATATLTANATKPADFSFLPSLVNPLTVRRPPVGAPGHLDAVPH